MVVTFFNGQEKLFKSGYVQLFRKGDLLYMTDSIKGQKLTDKLFQCSRPEIVEDLRRFAGHYPCVHFGGVPGRVYIDFNEKLDKDVDSKPVAEVVELHKVTEVTEVREEEPKGWEAYKKTITDAIKAWAGFYVEQGAYDKVGKLSKLAKAVEEVEG